MNIEDVMQLFEEIAAEYEEGQEELGEEFFDYIHVDTSWDHEDSS